MTMFTYILPFCSVYSLDMTSPLIVQCIMGPDNCGTSMKIHDRSCKKMFYSLRAHLSSPLYYLIFYSLLMPSTKKRFFNQPCNNKLCAFVTRTFVISRQIIFIRFPFNHNLISNILFFFCFLCVSAIGRTLIWWSVCEVPLVFIVSPW